jgi:SAM-dependent methyltransferase
VRLKQRGVDLFIRLTAVPGRIGWVARRLLGWTEPKDISELYRMLLGRRPEPSELEAKLGTHWRVALEDLLSSEEYEHPREEDFAARFLKRIEDFSTSVDVTPKELDRLFQHTRTYWDTAGSDVQTAYWSVLSTDDWLGSPSRDQVLAFYETGRDNAETLISIAGNLRPEFCLSEARVLDFGCGIGRVLRHFVGRAARCEGWDFSASHLKLLEDNFIELFQLDRSAFATRILDSPHIEPMEAKFDFAYSLITLQHNPPPVMAHMLRVLLRSLAPGGLALVHLTTAPAIEGYAFSVDEYHKAEPRRMEMHALPRDSIFDIAREEGATVPWARYTNWCGPSFLNELIAFVKTS